MSFLEYGQSTFFASREQERTMFRQVLLLALQAEPGSERALWFMEMLIGLKYLFQFTEGECAEIRQQLESDLAGTYK